jgi:hypothetical protein
MLTSSDDVSQGSVRSLARMDFFLKNVFEGALCFALLCYALLPIHFDEVANLCCCKLTISVDATFVGSLVEMKMKKMMLLLFSFRGREEETRPRAKDLLLFSAALVVLQFLTKTRSFDFERCTG